MTQIANWELGCYTPLYTEELGKKTFDRLPDQIDETHPFQFLWMSYNQYGTNAIRRYTMTTSGELEHIEEILSLDHCFPDEIITRDGLTYPKFTEALINYRKENDPYKKEELLKEYASIREQIIDGLSILTNEVQPYVQLELFK